MRAVAENGTPLLGIIIPGLLTSSFRACLFFFTYKKKFAEIKMQWRGGNEVIEDKEHLKHLQIGATHKTKMTK